MRRQTTCTKKHSTKRSSLKSRRIFTAAAHQEWKKGKKIRRGESDESAKPRNQIKDGNKEIVIVKLTEFFWIWTICVFHFFSFSLVSASPIIIPIPCHFSYAFFFTFQKNNFIKLHYFYYLIIWLKIYW